MKNKVIAEALLEISQRSTTTFLEVAKEDTELIDAAKKVGITLPSPDLMVMKTIYAEIGKPNRNKVILDKKDVEEGLHTLIGKQCNWEHEGAGYICGYTISASINGEDVETINVLFKSSFPEQAEELKTKMANKEASVSFEIYNKNPDTEESVVTESGNGYRRISPVIFHGTGVLLAHKPACPKAKIFKVYAEEKIFENDLVYAELAIEEPLCKKCEKCTCEEKEENKVSENLEVTKEVIVEAKKKDGDSCDIGEGKMGELHIDSEGKESCMMPESHKKIHEETMNSSTETKPVEELTGAETKVEIGEKTDNVEAKQEVTSTEVKVERATVITTKTENTVVDTIVENKEVIETTEKVSQEIVNDVGDKSTQTIETTQVKTYTYEEVQTEIAKVKEEKDKEIAILKAEIETLKTPKVEVAKEKEVLDLTVGNVVVNNEDKLDKIARQINERAFGKKK